MDMEMDIVMGMDREMEKDRKDTGADKDADTVQIWTRTWKGHDRWHGHGHISEIVNFRLLQYGVCLISELAKISTSPISPISQ
jgi:hypothetical protein